MPSLEPRTGTISLASSAGWTALIGVLVVLLSTTFHVSAQNPTTEGNVCSPDANDGCIQGVVVDDFQKPVGGIKVELVPTSSAGDIQWSRTLHQWTDKLGAFRLQKVEPGEYLVAIHRDDAPDAREPFATYYYPGVKEERDARRINIGSHSTTDLRQLRLTRLELVTINISVLWSDGSRPKRSNLLFHNPDYPQQGVVGDVAPEVQDGSGQFSLPKGFTYYARATVQCSGQNKIDTRESPMQVVKVVDEFTPKEMIFVVPGPTCALWQPNSR